MNRPMAGWIWDPPFLKRRLAAVKVERLDERRAHPLAVGIRGYAHKRARLAEPANRSRS